MHERHTPARVLVVTPTAGAARWFERILLDRATTGLLGLRIIDIENLVMSGARHVAGEAVPTARLKALVKKTLCETSANGSDSSPLIDIAR